MKNDTPPLPKKKPAVFHHPLGFELYDGLAMDLHAMTYAEPMLKEIEELRDSLKFYKRRCDALQEWQSKMRDPERTIVCDILANGITLHPDYSGDRYKVPPNNQVERQP